MRNFIQKTRTAIDKIAELWSDRDIHIPAIRRAIRDLPQKFKEADREQQRNVIIVVSAIVIIQILLFTAI